MTTIKKVCITYNKKWKISHHKVHFTWNMFLKLQKAYFCNGSNRTARLSKEKLHYTSQFSYLVVIYTIISTLDDISVFHRIDNYYNPPNHVNVFYRTITSQMVFNIAVLSLWEIITRAILQSNRINGTHGKIKIKLKSIHKFLWNQSYVNNRIFKLLLLDYK